MQKEFSKEFLLGSQLSSAKKLFLLADGVYKPEILFFVGPEIFIAIFS
jgi:hypothetical protein